MLERESGTRGGGGLLQVSGPHLSLGPSVVLEGLMINCSLAVSIPAREGHWTVGPKRGVDEAQLLLPYRNKLTEFFGPGCHNTVFYTYYKLYSTLFL